MPLDVNELRSFYASPLGDVARRLIGRVLRMRWDNCVGLSLMGLGFGAPYLEDSTFSLQGILELYMQSYAALFWFGF